ncbi:hypothetical protein HTZ77_36475 [Nonomuraea sp. SMC257]|uniref:DUF4439 domain-containing protein n=1 Tax=Nonomuraea montanisoli TaxID=2741721 RepID=A0A7Y6IHD1_9ACTN|nr:hypothetical protein [Nonomuraea montanisoli]NUW36864.1 hypothetical protein [Nonomuraea montanisoli]
MGPSLSRRAVLAGGTAVVALTGCSGEDGDRPAAAPAEPPELVLARELIADKERVIGLYGVLIGKGAGELAPFRDRHQAHLAELRRRFPAAASPAPGTGTAPPSGTPSSGAASPGAPTAGAAKVSLSSLRETERRAAAQRVRRLSGIAPSMAQLVASIGACEAAHALALPRSL